MRHPRVRGDSATAARWRRAAALLFGLGAGALPGWADDFTLTTGTYSVNGQTQTFGTFTNTGGTLEVGNGTLNVDRLSIGGGLSTVGVGGTINVGAGGVDFFGSAPQDFAPLVQTQNGAPAGRIVLGGNLTSTMALPPFEYAAMVGGVIDLAGGTRTFGVASGHLLIHSAVENGGIVKRGAGMLQLSLSSLRYAGGTVVREGTLRISSAPGSVIRAITIDGGHLEASASATPFLDVTFLRGLFTPGYDSGPVLGPGGYTIGALRLLGGSSTVSRDHQSSAGALVVGDGGTLLIRGGGEPQLLGLPPTQYLGNLEGKLTVGSGGLTFSGDAGSTVTVEAGTTGGVLRLTGDVEFNGLAGTAAVVSTTPAVGEVRGRVDLGGGARSILINDGAAAADVRVSAELFNGSLVKRGAGTLRLEGANAHAAMTVTGGAVEAMHPQALGAGAVTLAGGRLVLRGEGAAATPVVFANPIRLEGDGAVRVEGLGGAGAAFRAGAVTVGAARLTVEGGAGSTLEVAGVELTGHATLSVGVPVTVNGAISQSSGGLGFTKSESLATLTLAGAAANTYTGLTRVNAGAVVLNKPAGVAAVPGDLSVFGGSVTLAAAEQIADGGAVSLTNAGTRLELNGRSETVRSLTIAAGAVVTGGAASAGGGGDAPVLRVGALAFSGRGTLDLGGHRLIVDYAAGDPTPAPFVREAIVFARGSGDWSGAGLTSSKGAGRAGGAVGFAEAAELFGPSGGTFAGQGVDGTALLVRYTLLGDATLDGVVDFNDLVRLAQNYNVADGARTWADGDFTYDGRVDFGDLVGLAQNYNTDLAVAAGPGLSLGDDLRLALASVPEPGGVVWGCASAFAWALGRRR